MLGLLDSCSLVVELVGLIGHFMDVAGSGFLIVLLVKFVIFWNLLSLFVLDIFFDHAYEQMNYWHHSQSACSIESFHGTAGL